MTITIVKQICNHSASSVQEVLLLMRKLWDAYVLRLYLYDYCTGFRSVRFWYITFSTRCLRRQSTSGWESGQLATLVERFLHRYQLGGNAGMQRGVQRICHPSMHKKQHAQLLLAILEGDFWRLQRCEINFLKCTSVLYLSIIFCNDI